MGLLSISSSWYQFNQATTIDGKVEHGLDIFMGAAGFISGLGTGVSLFWSFGGKELHRMYVERVLMEQIKMGINPGLPEYQSSK